MLDAWMRTREPKGTDGKRGGVKESLRWIEGDERAAERACAWAQVRQVYVADREADILALLCKAREMEHAADYLILIRCQHDRALPEGGKLWACLAQAPRLGQVSFDLPAGRGRKARVQRIRVERIELNDDGGARLGVTCVLAEEIDPPPGVKPVVWRLLSKRDGEPDAKTLWLGLRDVAVFVDGTQAARKEERCV